MAADERQVEEAIARPAPAAEPAPASAPGMGLDGPAATVVGLSRSAGNGAVVGLASGSATPPPNLASLGALARAARYGTLPLGGPIRLPDVDAAEAEEDEEHAGAKEATAARATSSDGLASGFADALQRRSLSRWEDTGADLVDPEMTNRLKRASDAERIGPATSGRSTEPVGDGLGLALGAALQRREADR